MRAMTAAVLFALLVLPTGARAQDLPESSPEAVAAHARGIAAYLAADYDEAIQHFYGAYELDPTFYVALFMAGLSHGNAGRGEQSDSLYAIVAAHKQRLSPYFRTRLEAQMASRAGDREKYVALNRKAAEAAPGTKAAYNVAQGAVGRRRPAEALAALRTLDPDREPMRGWYSYYSVYTSAVHALGEHEDELAMARRARAAFPNDLGPRSLEAQALAALGRTAELDRVLDEIASLPAAEATSPGQIYTMVGLELAAHGHDAAARRAHEGAVSWFAAAPVEQAGSRLHRQQQAYALYAAGRPMEAAAAYRALAADFPDIPVYQAWIGFLAAQNGDPATAAEVSARIEAGEIQLSPLNSSFFRGLISAARGERDEAVALFDGTGAWARWIHRDPVLRSKLGGHPGFIDFLRPRG
ncbi:MAG: hypothetical protein KY466_06090 [Gemmatimonadetes bacterium]|nr:hypothetical protein [Gemmatimonadota bacterium]